MINGIKHCKCGNQTSRQWCEICHNKLIKEFKYVMIYGRKPIRRYNRV